MERNKYELQREVLARKYETILKDFEDTNDDRRIAWNCYQQIIAACGMQPAQLLNQVGKLIASIYPECDPALFTIYKRCGDYIKSKIL